MKKPSLFLLLLAIIAAYTSANGQDINLAWVNHMGGITASNNNAESAVVKTDASGNVYKMNSFTVNKLDVSGNLVWEKYIGSFYCSSCACSATSMTIDIAGNIYTTGYFTGTVDFDPNAGVVNLTSSGGGMFISKLDAFGNLVWAKAMTSTANGAFSRSIVIDITGNVYTTGGFLDTVDFDPNIGVMNLTGTGIFVSKLDISGNFVWAKAMRSTVNGVSLSIALDAAGNIYTTGHFSGTVDFDPNSGILNVVNLISTGSSDIFISKLNANGNFVWAKTIGGISYDYAKAITIDATGNIYITGYFSGTVDFDPNLGATNLITSISYGDMFISKFDTSGNFVWAKAIGGAGNGTNANAIVLDAANNIYTAGYFQGIVDFDPNIGVVNLTSHSYPDIFISKLDANGNFIWAKAMIGNSHSAVYYNQVTSIALDVSNNFYIAGCFSSTLNFNPNACFSNITASGWAEFFVAKYKQCSTTLITTTNLADGGSGSTYSQTLTQTGLAGTPIWLQWAREKPRNSRRTHYGTLLGI